MDTNPIASTAAKPMRPKIIRSGELIKSTLDTYKSNWKKFATILFIPLFSSFVLNYLMSLAEIYFKGQEIVYGLLVLLVFLPLFIVIFVFSVNSQIAQFLLLEDLNQSVSFGNLRDWLKRTWPYFMLVVVTGLIYGLIVMFGFIVLIIPGIVIMVIYSFSVFSIFFEKDQPEGFFAKVEFCLKKGRDLVRGYFWAVLGRFCLGALIVWLAYFAVMLIFGISYSFFVKLSPISVPDAIINLFIGFFALVGNLIIEPLTLLYTYNIYKSLKEVKK